MSWFRLPKIFCSLHIFAFSILFGLLGDGPVQADLVLLIDAFASGTNGGDPQTHADWANAGLIGDTSSAAGVTVTTSLPFNATSLTSSVVGAGGSFSAGTFGTGASANRMMNGYIFVNNASATVTLGGFQNTITTNSTNLGDMNGNSFTMTPNTDYTLTLWGAGDSNNQNTKFTFNGIEKTTASAIVGTSPSAGHSVSYDFTTPSSLSGYQIQFAFANSASAFGAWNGAAITAATAVPEPSSLLLFGLVGTCGLIARRRHQTGVLQSSVQ